MSRKPRQKGNLFLLFTTLFLSTGCAAQREQLASQSIGSLLVGLLLAILGLAALLLLIYLERRWQLLRLVRLQYWVRKIPVVGPYLSQGMQLRSRVRRADEFQQRVGKAAAHDAAQLRGEENNQSRYKRSFIEDAQQKGRQLVGRVDGGEKRRWWRNPFARREEPDVEEQNTDDTVEATPQATLRPNGTVPIEYGRGDSVATVEPSVHIGRAPVAPEFIFDLSEEADEVDIIGRRIDRYQVDARLSRDEVSTLYQAFDLKLGRQVRLQVIAKEIATDSATQTRILQKVRIAAAIDHPLIVVYDYDTAQDHLFIVSEHVAGVAIDRYIQQLEAHGQRVSYTLMLETMADVADALALVHEQGIIHGGLTPQRILLEHMPAQTHQVKITDLGLAQFYPAVSQPPQSLWPYLAPEQWEEQPVDGRADIYALGIVLYQMVTGHLPFAVESYEDAQTAHTSRTPLAPSQLRRSLPSSVELLILKAMAADPSQRFQSSYKFAEALRQVASDLKENIEKAESLLASAEQCIVVTTQGEPARIVPLDRDTFYIGSATDNDLVLLGIGVAAQHVRVDAVSGGWEVVDLGAAGGTQLSGASLLPDLPEFWEPEQPLQIGTYHLNLREIGDLTPATEAPAQVSVGLTLMPSTSDVVPGQRVDFQIGLRNQGSQVDHFTIEIVGVPASWVALSDNDLELMPARETFVLLTVTPPQDSSARAGEYPFTVTVRSTAKAGQFVAVNGELQVASFENLITDLYPEHLADNATTQLTLENQGNLTLYCILEGRDSDDALEFAFDYEGESFTLPAGEKRTLDVQVSAKKRPWWGITRQIAFDIDTITQADNRYLESGRMTQAPIVPAWLLGLMTMLGMLLCLFLVLVVDLLPDSSSEENTPTVAVAQVIASPTPAPTLTATIAPLPNTCAMIRQQNADSGSPLLDGEYTLYLEHDANRPMTIYCHNMENNPVEYLTLGSLETDSNFSIVAYPDQELVTHYFKIRLHPVTLTVDRTDRLFASVVGEIPDHYEQPINDFGATMGCSTDSPVEIFGRANIDLTATTFIIHPDVTFKLGGKQPNGSIDITPDRAIVNLSATGQCGWVWPSDDLRLQYVGLSFQSESR